MAKSIIDITSDLEKVVDKAFAPELLKSALNRAVLLAGTDARDFMWDRCPVSAGWEFKGKGKIGHRKSGDLINSLSGGPNGIFKEDKQAISMTIGSRLPYADSIISQDGKHSGGPYQIRPKSKKYLVFPIGPNPKTDVIRTKLVTHPGAKEIARRKTGKSVAIMTQAKEMVEKDGEKYIENAVKFTMEAFR